MKILYISILFFLLSFDLKSYGLSNDSSLFVVKYVKSINGTNDFIESEGFFNKVKGFFLGRDDYRFVKPINLFAQDTNKLLVLDPGLYSIISYNYTDRDYIFLNEKIGQRFGSLVGIAKLNENEFLFTDSERNEIYCYNEADKSIKIFNDSLNLTKPEGIALLKSRNQIWIVETGNHRLVVTDLQGNILKTYGERGELPGMFNFPTFISINNDKDLIYITDALNYRVQIFTPDFELKSVFGKSGDAPGYFASMKGIAIDSYGHIFVVDAILNMVQVFDIFGNFLYSFGKQGKGNGEFWMPIGIYIDMDNFIYVTDSYNCRIQVFKLVKVS